MQALGDDRFQHQVSDCLNTLTLAYETASLHRANPSEQPHTSTHSTDYSVHTVWSETTPRTMTDALTIIISVPLAAHHYLPCDPSSLHQDLSLALQPLMYDVKYCTPSKFRFILLLHDTDAFIETLPSMCFPIAPASQRLYLNVVLAEIVRLFRMSNEMTECEYLTVWGSSVVSERVLGVVEGVARRGMVRVENGVRRARLVPLR